MISEVDVEHVGQQMIENILDLHMMYLLFNKTTGQILGISENFYASFGLKSSLFKIPTANSPNIEMLCPDVLNPDKFKALAHKGSEITFDTSTLKDNYYFMNYDDDDEEYSLVEEEIANKRNNQN